MKKKKYSNISWVIIASLFIEFLAPSEYLYSQNENYTIAVLNFESHTGDDDDDAMLSTGTAETIMSDLSNVSRVTIIERSKLKTINKEIILGLSGLIDEETAQKTGKQVGAEYVVIGSWQKSGKQYRVNARLINVETGKVVTSVKETGFKIFDLQDRIVLSILYGLNITPSTIEIKNIAKRETESLDAYKEFSKGIREFDKGNITEMKEHMKNAVKIDPNYDKPQEYVYVIYDRFSGEKHNVTKSSTFFEAHFKRIFMSGLFYGGFAWLISPDGKGYDYFIVGFGTGTFLSIITSTAKKEKKNEDNKEKNNKR